MPWEGAQLSVLTEPGRVRDRPCLHPVGWWPCTSHNAGLSSLPAMYVVISYTASNTSNLFWSLRYLSESLNIPGPI